MCRAVVAGPVVSVVEVPWFVDCYRRVAASAVDQACLHLGCPACPLGLVLCVVSPLGRGLALGHQVTRMAGWGTLIPPTGDWSRGGEESNLRACGAMTHALPTELPAPALSV